MSFISRLSGIVSLQQEEKKSFRYLFLLSLVTGIGLSYYFVAVNTFLIKKASVSNLPYAYIISGLGGILLIKIYQYRQRTSGITGSYKEGVISFFVIALGVFLAFTRLGADENLAIYLAYLGFLFVMPFTVIFALGFFAICGRLYNLSQSKRLLALVSTGEIIASIIGYLTAPLISKLSGSPNYLLLASAICILPAIIPVQLLSSGNKEKLAHAPVSRGALKKLDLNFFKSERFYLLIAIASLFSVAAIYFVDYSYLVTVRFMAEYSGLEIATIVGFFFSLVKIGELIFSFLSGHILSSKGLKFSILLLPLLLSGCFLLALVGGMIFGSEPIFILSFIFLAKFSERVIRKAISTPAIKVLYQVTGPDRLRIEATIEGVLNQVATVIAGILLLVISGVFAKADTIFFLSIISGICLLLFASWSAVSLGLYENYRKKVWSYLTEIRSKGASIIAGAIQEYKLQDLSQPAANESLKQAIKNFTDPEKAKNISSLAVYAPALLNHEEDDKLMLSRKLSSTYYSNDNFFFRLAVIRYLRTSDEKFSIRTLKEFGEISDLTLKVELVLAYNQSGMKPEPSEVFYFEDLCYKYSNELILALSAQNDLRNIDDSELQAELKWHTDKITRLLFELLKVLYDASAVEVIYDIITSEDHQDLESRLFALELLDNTVNDELKQRLIPVFEPAPFDQKIYRLQKFVPVYAMPEEQQLKELLMNDFKLINPRLKEIALNAYYKLTGDPKVLKAFGASSIRNLKVRADQIREKAEQNEVTNLVNEIARIFSLDSVQSSYIYNQAIYLPGERKEQKTPKSQIVNPYLVNMGTEKGGLGLDTYALALLIDNNQSGA